LGTSSGGDINVSGTCQASALQARNTDSRRAGIPAALWMPRRASASPSIDEAIAATADRLRLIARHLRDAPGQGDSWTRRHGARLRRRST